MISVHEAIRNAFLNASRAYFLFFFLGYAVQKILKHSSGFSFRSSENNGITWPSTLTSFRFWAQPSPRILCTLKKKGIRGRVSSSCPYRGPNALHGCSVRSSLADPQNSRAGGPPNNRLEKVPSPVAVIYIPVQPNRVDRVKNVQAIAPRCFAYSLFESSSFKGARYEILIHSLFSFPSSIFRTTLLQSFSQS